MSGHVGEISRPKKRENEMDQEKQESLEMAIGAALEGLSEEIIEQMMTWDLELTETECIDYLHWVIYDAEFVNPKEEEQK